MKIVFVVFDVSKNPAFKIKLNIKEFYGKRVFRSSNSGKKWEKNHGQTPPKSFLASPVCYIISYLF